MDIVDVFVDGACRNNGHNNPQAGCGVYWGPFHPLNWSETLKGDRQTNNRAELSAAIIGITQAMKCGINENVVITDSKYVKEGITKWIKERKLNEWKTAKKRSDVLNKDLWLILDRLQGMLAVDWRWVEGHQDHDGNIQADDLAKKGISAECELWQELAYSLCDRCGDSASPTIKPVVPQSYTTENRITKPEYICKSCRSACLEKDHALQCQECKYWIHYKCSDLPVYQLFLYENTQRRFTCKFCVNIDEDFLTSYKQESPCQQEGRNKGMKIQNTVDAESMTSRSILVDKDTETDEEFAVYPRQKTSTPCQTEDLIGLHYLEEFKKSTVSLFEESFVGAFDRINNSVRDLRTNLAEENDLKQRLTDLTKENEKLRACNRERDVGKKIGRAHV